MSSTSRHLVYALLWLAFLTLVAVVFISGGANTDIGRRGFYGQVGSFLFAMGFTAIFYSWARADAPVHNKSIKSAAVFAALWFFFSFLAHVAYLFYTRGFRNGTLATLKFACFLLAVGIAWSLFGRALGAIR